MDLHPISSILYNPHIIGLCLTYHVNLKLSTRKTVHALKENNVIYISYTMLAKYAMTVTTVIKPFIDTFDYKPSIRYRNKNFNLKRIKTLI